jgi:hypothetical protein
LSKNPNPKECRRRREGNRDLPEMNYRYFFRYYTF